MHSKARSADGQELNRASLAGRPARMLGPSAWNKPSVKLVDLPGGPVVVKDFSSMPAPVRLTYGAWILWRETAVYRRLNGVEGVPPYRGKLDRWAFVIDYVDGSPLGTRLTDVAWPEFFKRLEALVRRLHDQRIVHLDLRQRRNILLGGGDLPCLVDFSTSLYFPRLAFPLTPLFWFFSWVDRMAVLKFKARRLRGSLTITERHMAMFSEFWSKMWPFNWLR